MANKTLTFQLTPEQFEQRKEIIAQAGIQIPNGNIGEISHKGVTVKYAYDGVSQLQVVVEHKPWMIPTSTVESKITEWFQGPAKLEVKQEEQKIPADSNTMGG